MKKFATLIISCIATYVLGYVTHAALGNQETALRSANVGTQPIVADERTKVEAKAAPSNITTMVASTPTRSLDASNCENDFSIRPLLNKGLGNHVIALLASSGNTGDLNQLKLLALNHSGLIDTESQGYAIISYGPHWAADTHNLVDLIRNDSIQIKKSGIAAATLIPGTANSTLVTESIMNEMRGSESSNILIQGLQYINKKSPERLYEAIESNVNVFNDEATSRYICSLDTETRHRYQHICQNLSKQ